MRNIHIIEKENNKFTIKARYGNKDVEKSNLKYEDALIELSKYFNELEVSNG